MKKFFFLVTASLLACFSPAAAQERNMSPPPVLLVVREDIKPGKMPAHTKHSASFVQIFATYKRRATG